MSRLSSRTFAAARCRAASNRRSRLVGPGLVAREFFEQLLRQIVQFHLLLIAGEKRVRGRRASARRGAGRRSAGNARASCTSRSPSDFGRFSLRATAPAHRARQLIQLDLLEQRIDAAGSTQRRPRQPAAEDSSLREASPVPAPARAGRRPASKSFVGSRLMPPEPPDPPPTIKMPAARPTRRCC